MKIKNSNENLKKSWKSWNFTKFIDFLDSATLHETFVFLAQNQGLSGLDPHKPKNPEKPLISWKSPKFQHFRRFPGKSAKWCKNHFLEDSVGSLAATCSKHCHSYRNIEVFKLPGRTRNAPKYQKWWNFPQNLKILQKSWNFWKFHEISWKFMTCPIFDQFSGFWRLRNLDIP